jgi:ABC-type multidrug transport system fused ATPase/permease subunit
VGAVLQDSILFNATIRENLLYADPGATNQEIMSATRSAAVHEFVMSLEDGYDTVIGEGGVKLSVGEKQRLSIARAILTNPTILIMDEATSSLDSRSERLIQVALENVLAGRTTFIIAHRLATIVKADIIVVMDQGCIIEKGSHEELLAIPKGAYKRLYEEQFAAQLEQASSATAEAGS